MINFNYKVIDDDATTDNKKQEKIIAWTKTMKFNDKVITCQNRQQTKDCTQYILGQ